MVKLYRVLSIIVSVVVLCAWSIKLNQPSIFRGGSSTNMFEEFEAYGLNYSMMLFVGICKVFLASILFIGGVKSPKLIKPAASGMALFMSFAVYFHISIGDGIIPTLPSICMLIICLFLIFSPNSFFISRQG